jgi:hypothetical protein
MYKAMLFSLFAFCANCFAVTVSFDATQSNQTVFTTFGAMVWDGAAGNKLTALQNLFQLPGFQMARINHELRASSISTTGNLAYYQSMWNSYGDPATDLLLPNGTFTGPVKHLFLVSIHPSFKQSDGRGGFKLISGVNLQSLAYYIAAGVQHFNQVYGALHPANPPKADYIELSNEPDGDWTVSITPTQYTTLLKKVYTQLATLAPTSKIAGPGVSHVDWSGGTDSFVNSIIKDSTALSNLGAWSVHQYVFSTVLGVPYENKDAGTSINGYGETAARYFFPKWYATPKSKGPAKPVIVSEVGTKATGFHGHPYSPPNAADLCTTGTSTDCTIVNTASFGVRLYTYLISLLAGGANAALYWEAMDQTWYTSGLGLLDVNGQQKDNYFAMLPLFQNIVPNSTVLVSSSTQAGNDIYSVAFLSPKNPDGTVNTIVLAHANGTGNSTPISRTTTVTNLPSAATGFVAATQLYQQVAGGTVYQGELLDNDPNSTFTLSNGTLTHTTTLAQDTTITATITLTY